MAIGHVVTRGYGTGTFAGDIDLVPTRGYLAAAEQTIVTLSGTIIPANASAIVAGGRTIILTLTNDTWVAAGGTFDAQRQNIIDGLDSAGAEATGWNAEVRDKEVVGAVARTSDTVVTITLSAAAAYSISASEEITATIPDTALVSSALDVVATPTFTITAVTAGTSGGRRMGRILPPIRKTPRRTSPVTAPVGTDEVEALIAQFDTPRPSSMEQVARALATFDPTQPADAPGNVPLLHLRLDLTEVDPRDAMMMQMVQLMVAQHRETLQLLIAVRADIAAQEMDRQKREEMLVEDAQRTALIATLEAMAQSEKSQRERLLLLLLAAAKA